MNPQRNDSNLHEVEVSIAKRVQARQQSKKKYSG